MADEIWVNGEMAHKNASTFINDGGVPGVSAGTVDQAAFCVRNRNNAREWLFNELERQRYREAYNITFDTDDGHEKERFAAARQEYFDTYGEDFMGKDPDMPWQDTWPGEADKTDRIDLPQAEAVDSEALFGQLSALESQVARLAEALHALEVKMAEEK